MKVHETAHCAVLFFCWSFVRSGLGDGRRSGGGTHPSFHRRWPGFLLGDVTESRKLRVTKLRRVCTYAKERKESALINKTPSFLQFPFIAVPRRDCLQHKQGPFALPPYVTKLKVLKRGNLITCLFVNDTSLLPQLGVNSPEPLTYSLFPFPFLREKGFNARIEECNATLTALPYART